ncbi:MAG: GLPGLI family protein [Saprospiraceae bacterium]
MRIKILLFGISMLVVNFVNGQVKQGVIKYKQTNYLEFENMPADMPKSVESFVRLTFNSNESLYEKDPDIKEDENPNDNTPRMFRRMRNRPMKTVYKNLEKEIALEQTNVFGKDFLITDSLNALKWKVSAGEQKNILGYLCMKATFIDSTRNLVVFFTPQIPIKFGPDTYGDLPGIILEVQSAQLHILATEIKTEAGPIKAPTKGDKMNRTDFEKMREAKMKEQRELWGNRGGEVRVIRQ